jgi:Tfp pilus assembly protein PilF
MDPPQKTRPPLTLFRLIAFIVLGIIGLASAAVVLQAMTSWYFNHLGSREAKTHHIAAAVRDFRIAVRLTPTSSIARNNLAYYLYVQGNYPEALVECHEALHFTPNYAPAHDTLGQILSHTGHLKESVQECHTAIRLMPDDAVFYNSLGYALCKEGKRVEARQQWQRAAAMDNPSAAQDARSLLAEHPESAPIPHSASAATSQ